MSNKYAVGTSLEPTVATLQASVSLGKSRSRKSERFDATSHSTLSTVLPYSETESLWKRCRRLPWTMLHQLTGGEIAQACLARTAIVSQRMMGIGAGAGVMNSGEANLFKMLRRRASGSLVVFDVGANHGQFLSLALKSLEGEDYHIHCFEPSKEAFGSLLSRGPESRVILNNFAVGNCEGTRVLYYDRSGSGMASLTKRELAHRGIRFDQSEDVSVATLDSYCETHEIHNIDLLKLDIEGHELEALRGAERTFDRNAVGMVMFEMGGCNVDTRTFFRDFWRFFTDRKMTLHRITPSGRLLEIRRYKETHEQFRTTNFVAIRQDDQQSEMESC